MKNNFFVKSAGLLCLVLGLSGCINDADVLPEDNSGSLLLFLTVLRPKPARRKLRVFIKPVLPMSIM